MIFVYMGLERKARCANESYNLKTYACCEILQRPLISEMVHLSIDL